MIHIPANDDYDISTPSGARKYIEDFAPRHCGKTATYIRTSNSRLIHFKTMSDEDAIWIAQQFKSWEDKAKNNKKDQP